MQIMLTPRGKIGDKKLLYATRRYTYTFDKEEERVYTGS
jgi:hypothetical protein